MIDVFLFLVNTLRCEEIPNILLLQRSIVILSQDLDMRLRSQDIYNPIMWIQSYIFRKVLPFTHTKSENQVKLKV